MCVSTPTTNSKLARWDARVLVIGFSERGRRSPASLRSDGTTVRGHAADDQTADKLLIKPAPANAAGGAADGRHISGKGTRASRMADESSGHPARRDLHDSLHVLGT